LPHFYAHVQGGSKIPHQVPEVHAALRDEVKDDPPAVQGILRAHQLHRQIALADLFPAEV